MSKVFDLSGKIAIVTGSTSGIGIGIAEVFAEQGAHVVICGRRPEKGQQIVDDFKAKGLKASFHVLDITSEESIKALIDDTVAEFGKLDILANNAANTKGHVQSDGNIADITSDFWDATMQSDLRSVFLSCKYAIPHMKKNGGGAIVNTGSGASIAGNNGMGAYSSAKGGIENLTRNIAYQYGKDNIRCNCIRPGFIITPQNQASIPDFMREVYLKETEVNRLGCPRDIAYTALFLVADESGYVTSQILTVDGGMWSHAPQNTGMKEAAAKLYQQKG